MTIYWRGLRRDFLYIRCLHHLLLGPIGIYWR